MNDTVELQGHPVQQILLPAPLIQVVLKILGDTQEQGLKARVIILDDAGHHERGSRCPARCGQFPLHRRVQEGADPLQHRKVLVYFSDEQRQFFRTQASLHGNIDVGNLRKTPPAQQGAPLPDPLR
jgi:hypothetical protein